MRRSRQVISLAAVATTITLVSVAAGGSPATAPTAAAATAPPAAPLVTTGAGLSTGPSSETLNGTVNPKGQSTTYYFEYGLSTTYSSSTPHTHVGNGTAAVPVSAAITALAPSTTYHFRVVAVGAGGAVYGDDKTFTSGQTTSQVRVMGREGFVSPGGVIGVEVGCFVGQTTCAGNIQLTHNGTVVGQRSYSIAPESGGFQNLKLTPQGQALLRQNSVWNLLGVDVTVKDSTGQTLSYVIHLARWVWH